MSQVLWNVRLLDLEAGLATERCALTIDDGRISAIDDSAGQLPPEARDFDGATVLPGLIDAHCHVLSNTERSPGFGPPPQLHGGRHDQRGSGTTSSPRRANGSSSPDSRLSATSVATMTKRAR